MREYNRVWKPSNNGFIDLKDACMHLNDTLHTYIWGNFVWNPTIPPSKSLVFWSLNYGNLPTDDKLIVYGMHMPHICRLCLDHEKNLQHLFFYCMYVHRSWSWLVCKLDNRPIIHFIKDYFNNMNYTSSQ